MPPVRPFVQIPFAELPERPRLPHPYFELASREVVVDSAAFGRVGIHLREVGDGKPLLLIHGLMTTGYSFRYVAQPLAEAGFRVLIPDLVGCGRSDKPDVAYPPEALAGLIGELVETLDIAGCATLGNSLGGYLCLHLAVTRPSLLSRLVVLHSPARPEPRLYALHGALSLPGSEWLLGALMRRDVERWAHDNVHYWDETLKSREEAREYGGPLGTPEGARAFHRYLHDALSPRGFRSLARTLEERKARGERFAVPPMLLYARRDPMVPPENGPYLHSLIPEAELRWLEEGSHFAHVDAPDRVLDATLSYLRGA
jgi:pimeloyl-ACP methyl ester carboxylesterase